MDTRTLPLQLDEAAIDRARQQIDDGAVTPSAADWAGQVVQLLNGALATELVCVAALQAPPLHRQRPGIAAVADEFMVHANEEAGHADRIAERIVQLGGEPTSIRAPAGAQSCDYDDSLDLMAMVRANLVAERVAVETYRQMIRLVGDRDPTTRRMLEDILADEEEHADEMKDLLEG